MNIIKIFLVTFVMASTLGLGGCASPNTDIGARNNDYVIDKEKPETSDEFKITLRHAMPAGQKITFERYILDPNYTSDTWARQMRQEGSNVVTMSAMGISPTSSFGMGLGLGLSLVDGYMAKQSLMDRFNVAYFVDNEGKSKDDIFNEAALATKESVFSMAKDFGYSISCKFNCDTHSATYELVKLKMFNHPEVYEPEILVVALLFADIEEEENKAVIKLLASDDSSKVYFSGLWNVSIYSSALNRHNMDNPLDLKTEVDYSEAETEQLKHHGNSGKFLSMRGYPLERMPLGRDMYRSIAKKIPFWTTYTDKGYKNYGIYKGQMYWLDDVHLAEEMTGYPITN